MQKIKMFKYFAAGLMMVGSLLVATTAYAETQQGRLTGDHVRVRTYPSLDSYDNILFQVSRGQDVEILDTAGDFYRVNVRDSEEVYIFREFVRVVDPVAEALYEQQREEERQARIAARAETTGVLVDDLLAYAKSYIGTPYRFGSTDPSRGFDCSGFVMTAMRGVGVYLQRSSRDMAANNGIYVGRDELMPGDLVFFNTNGRNISHVGIYIGGNQFIHSESRRGVTITSMSDNYWRNRYVRANRVI